MASANIVALTNAAAFAPDALFYMGLSPFGVTDDRKITGSVLFTTIAPLNNNTAALVVTNSAVPTVPQVVFTNSGGTRRMQVAMAGAASITDTFDDVSIFSSIAAETLSLGIWNATDTGVGAELFLYTGAAGLAHLRIRATDGGAGNGNFLDVPNSGVLFTSNASTGGLILCTDEATAPIIFAAGDNAFANEKGRFDAAGFTLGKASSITGALNLANAASAFLTTITAGNAAAARTYVWPTNFGAAGSVLTDAGGNGTLSWVAAGAVVIAIGSGITSGTVGSVLFVGTGPALAQDNANFFWDDTNNRLGLGTTTPAKLLHVNGIAQLGTVSATTGQLQLANSASANLTTIQAGNAAAAVTYTWPLNVGASGSVLTDAAGNGTLSWAAAAPSPINVRAYASGAQTITNGTNAFINLNSEQFDTDGMHFTSSANLTGTVAKNGTATLTGTGTAFLSELSVGQVIMVPGTANERRVVTAIASDTSLTVAVAFVNTASGQVGVRQNSCLVARTAGTYQVSAIVGYVANIAGGRSIDIGLNTNVITSFTTIGSTAIFSAGAFFATIGTVSFLYQFAQWDFIDLISTQGSGGNLDTIPGLPYVSLMMNRVSA